VDLATVAIQDPSSATLARALLLEEVRLTRLAREYSQLPMDFLEKLREHIPSANANDLDYWRSQGHLNYVVIDGQLRYHRREPAGLFRLSAEARALCDEAKDHPQRAASREPRPPRTQPITTSSLPLRDPSASTRSASAPTTDPHSLIRHIPAALKAATDQQSTHVLPRNFRVRHEIRVLPGKVPPGETLRVWIPVPRDMVAAPVPSPARATSNPPPRFTG
jgi:hypothetical protein